MASKKLSVFFTVMIIFLFSIALGCTDNKKASEDGGTPPEGVHANEVPSNVSPSSLNSTSENISVPTIEKNNVNNSSSVSPTVTISSLMNNNSVKFNEPVFGNSTGVYGSGLHLYLLINPVEAGNDWWIQPEAIVNSDGTWRVNAQFGEGAQKNSGSKFFVSAVVTSANLSIGLSSYPSVVETRVDKDILVTRE